MLSIIITNYHSPVLLKLCLGAIKEKVTGVDYELVVMDCEANNENEEIIKNIFSDAKVVSFPKNVGYAKLINKGIIEATGDFILILNADIIIHKNAVEQMLNLINADSDIGIVGPHLFSFNNTHQNSCFAFPTLGALVARRTLLGKTKWGQKQLNHFAINYEECDNYKDVNWLQGSAMMVRREAINKAGLWDERFFMYFEDTDWCRRFWKNNYRVVYLPTACMYHYYGRQSKKWGEFLDPIFNKYTRMHLISALKYFWKWRKFKNHNL